MVPRPTNASIIGWKVQKVRRQTREQGPMMMASSTRKAAGSRIKITIPIPGDLEKVVGHGECQQQRFELTGTGGWRLVPLRPALGFRSHSPAKP